MTTKAEQQTKRYFRSEEIKWDGAGIYTWDVSQHAWTRVKDLGGLELYMRRFSYYPQYIELADTRKVF